MKMYTVENFLLAKTSPQWFQSALNNIPLLLVDHAHCEKKAAATALGLIYRYSDKPLLIKKMSKLAREELRHFEQVLAVIEGRGEKFTHLPPGEYAKSLHKHVTAHEPRKLVDVLIVGAFIEARSCERFGLIADQLPSELSQFYRKLYMAEARHFEEYLSLARHYSDQSIEDRIQFFGQVEAAFIDKGDAEFRFHS